MQEALEMTREEMDRAAHRLLLQEHNIGSLPITLPNFDDLDLDEEADEDQNEEEP
jgi:hypothetical protein